MNFKIALAAVAVVGLAGTAQAADLAKKAPAAADYVKVCDAYGAGFFYIPGSETCLKIGGYVRAEVRTGGHNAAGSAPGVVLGRHRGENSLNTRARIDLTFDARTNTEMGLLRSYIELRTTNDSTGNGTDHIDFPATAAAGSIVRVSNGIELYRGFIQFAGLTAGRADSFFDFVQGGYNIGTIEPDAVDHRVNLLGYTFSFGNGISASLAVEDETTTDQLVGWPKGTYAAVKVPHIVGNIAVSQAWGRAQVMAALAQNWGALADKFGYAVGAGVEVNLPMLGAGDKIFLQGVYTKGAIMYALNQNGGGAIDFSDATGVVEQSKAWNVSGGLIHYFTKQVSAAIGGSYVKYDAAATGTVDFKQMIVGGDVTWRPVNGLSIGVALDYRKVDFTAAPDTTRWMGTLRVQRSF